VPDLLKSYAWFYRAEDTFRYPVLEIEDVVQISLEAIGPDVISGGCVDQLTNDTNT
jgi:hypothetical protein